MGGVDLFDMLAALYRMDHRSSKWYRRIYLWGIRLACINSWLLYRRHFEQLALNAKSQLSLLKFISEISTGLIRYAQLPHSISKKRGRPSNAPPAENAPPAASVAKRSPKSTTPLPLIRFDTIGHFPTHLEKKTRCALCQSLVRIGCIKCERALCINASRNCFIFYHTP